ncbi:MAG: 23S rRNA (uracil(1939)-C(5))-methyltransferase RlmD [Clostridia bacterium]|nr:23S rRNA (uracil(1939)-C(5))-methyltransferase RlmD [Clostridia bacterium]
MRKNDIIELDITAASSEGAGIGRYENKAIFVPLTAIGDRAKIRILRDKKNLAFGKLEELITPSANRCEPDCESFSKCGGCVWRHISYDAECEIKENKVYEAMRRIGGIDMKPQPLIRASDTERYRNKAQFPISEDGSVGFYATHSHRVIPTPDCRLQPQVFSSLSSALKEWINKTGVTVYNEETNSGLVKHFYLRNADATGELMAVLIINGDNIPHRELLISLLREAAGENLKSVQLNINKKNSNVILGEKNILLYGKEYIEDILCGVKVRISPLSFYQVNRTMAEHLYNKAQEYAEPQGKNILDLYCGAGTIGLSMAKDANSIIGVEIIPDAVKDAIVNAKENGIENAEFICGDAAKAALQLKKRGIKPHAVIVDPPRKGCEEALLNTVARDFCPERIVYVSCDVATLSRDAKILETLGYRLIEYTPVDLFPRTAHVETVALFLKLSLPDGK